MNVFGKISDLAPADYFLFPQVKIFLKRAAFSNSVQWQGSLTTFQKLLSWRAWRSWRNVQTNVLIKEACILKNKNKLYPYKKLSVFYNSCLRTQGSHLICIHASTCSWASFLVIWLLKVRPLWCLKIWGTEYPVMSHHIAEKWVLHPSCWENVETCIHVVNVLLQPCCKRACTCLFLACQRIVCAVASGLENLPLSGPVLVGPSGHLLPFPCLWLRVTMPVFHSLLSPVSV